MFNEERGDVRGGIGNRSGDHAAAAKLIESWHGGVPADENGLVVLDTLDEDGGGETSVFENAAADQARDLARRGSSGEALVNETPRTA